MKQRCGFATLTAIALTGLTAVALAILASMFATEARQNRQIQADAQLRQLLHAGTELAIRQARRDDTAPRHVEVKLPDELKQHGAKLAVDMTRAQQPDQVSARIEAETGGRKMEQTILLTNTGNGWKVSNAQLGWR